MIINNRADVEISIGNANKMQAISKTDKPETIRGFRPILSESSPVRGEKIT